MQAHSAFKRNSVVLTGLVQRYKLDNSTEKADRDTVTMFYFTSTISVEI